MESRARRCGWRCREARSSAKRCRCVCNGAGHGSAPPRPRLQGELFGTEGESSDATGTMLVRDESLDAATRVMDVPGVRHDAPGG